MEADYFKVYREMFDKNVFTYERDFRVFMYLISNARYTSTPREIGDVIIERGQWLRSYRKLIADLAYIENHELRYYSLKAIKITLDRLVKHGRITVETTTLGTLFTIVNYDKYQPLTDDESEQPETDTKQIRNRPETIQKERKKGKEVKRTRFKKPTAEEVTEYAQSIDFDLDGNQFCDYYESKGWKVGNTPMKSWKASVRTWKRKRNEEAKKALEKKRHRSKLPW